MKEFRPLLAALAFVAIAAGASAAFAGISSTEAPTVYMVLLPDDSVEKGKTWPKTEEECVARAKAIIPAGSCSIRRKFTNAGTCADVAKPKWPRELDADGFVIKPGIRGKLKAGSDSDYDFEVEDNVPAPYPDCWVKGWRIADDIDLNGPDPDDPVLANVEEPVTPPAGYDEWWHSAAAEADRHAHFMCNADDKTPCPTRQVVPSACGPYWSVECGGPGIEPAEPNG